MVITTRIEYKENGESIVKTFIDYTSLSNLRSLRKTLETVEDTFSGKERTLIQAKIMIGNHTIEVKTKREVELIETSIHAVAWTIANEF